MKKISEETTEKRVAYEVSVSKLELVEDETDVPRSTEALLQE